MRYGVGAGREPHLAAGPSPFWWSAPYVINILLLKAKVKHRALCSPTRDYAFELKITFCVRGVISPLLSNLYMRRFVLGWKQLGHEKRLRAYVVNYADDLVICCRSSAEEALATMRRIMGRLKLTVYETKTRVC